MLYATTFSIMLNISRQGRELQKSYQSSYVENLSDLCNAVKKILDKFRVVGTLSLI